MNILFLDVETTGLDPHKHALLQIAAEYYEDGKLVSSFDENVRNMGAAVNLGALKVNKLTAQAITTGANVDPSGGQNGADPVIKFVDYLLGLGKKVTVCGHNVAFDLGFIKVAMAQRGFEGLESVLSHKVLDTATLALALQEAGIYTGDKTSVADLAAEFGVETKLPVSEDKLSLIVNNNLHNAAVDVHVTAKIYFAMIKRLKGLLNEANS